MCALLVWAPLAIGALLLIVLSAAAANDAGAQEVSESPFVTVGRTVRPAVVNIRTVRLTNDEGVGMGPLQEMYRQFFPDEAGKGGKFEISPTGSGFVVSESGDILTNNHVIARAEEIFVRFSGEQREYRAELAGTDPNTDLALLRIDPGGRDLPVLEFADSDAVEVGQWAIAVGNPFGNLESSLTVGVVSAKGRGDLVIGGGMTPRYQDFIQTDASINHGNSGGPLVNRRGRVIGVNTAINEKGQGIGFAVPSNLTRHVYAHLAEHGRVIRGYLGVRTEDVVQIVGEEVPGEPDSGARVLQVVAGSPAAGAGLQAGDIVVRFDGREVSSRRQLQFLIAGAAPGEEIECVIIRDGERKGIRLSPVEWIEQPDQDATPTALWLGMEVADLAGTDPRVDRFRDALGVTATTGILVVDVREDESGADAGIRPGDVILTIEGREMNGLDDWNEARSLYAAHRGDLTFLVRTGGMENYVRIRPRSGGVEN